MALLRPAPDEVRNIVNSLIELYHIEVHVDGDDDEPARLGVAS
jgi:hypothetical protein